MSDQKKFIGRIVNHKLWGEGVVESLEGYNVSVHFMKTDKGERSVTFQYPQIFIAGFIRFADEDLQRELELSIQESKCCFCNTLGVETEIIDGKRMCNKCKDKYSFICSFCNNRHNIDNRMSIFDYHDYISRIICSECYSKHTFECSNCGNVNLTSYRVNSRFILGEQNICESCVGTCNVCNEKFLYNQLSKSFGKCYCYSCLEKYKSNCEICNCEYVPKESGLNLCPDCECMQQYEARLQNLDISDCSYLNIPYGMLYNIDRCDMFTKLFENCYYRKMGALKDRTDEESFEFIVMRILWYNVVITFLPPKVIHDAQCSLNVTMSEFRSNKGLNSVCHAIKRWLPTSKSSMDTAAGKMRILNYPILLRVQTDYDKNYGKQWNGPDDYIEIGNYGDTTDFYIIGVID